MLRTNRTYATSHAQFLCRRPWDVLENIVQYIVRPCALGLALEVQQEPVPQGGQGRFRDVVEAHVIPLIEQGANLARQDQGLHAARRGAEADKPVRHLRREFALRVRRQGQPNPIILHMVGDYDASDQLLGPKDFLCVGDTLRPRLLAGRRPVQDRLELLAIAVADQQLEEETIQLGLGKRIRALLFDRVLGG